MTELFDPSGGAELEGPYRYLLWRRLAEGHKRVLFVMLNPSTADASKDDPTIRRCKGFARAWGFHELAVANLYAWRATKPAALMLERAIGTDVVGPLNDQVLRREARGAHAIVVAWGADAPASRAREAFAILRSSARAWMPIWALGVTTTGAPRHPLYVRTDAVRMPWEPPPVEQPKEARP